MEGRPSSLRAVGHRSWSLRLDSAAAVIASSWVAKAARPRRAGSEKILQPCEFNDMRGRDLGN